MSDHRTWSFRAGDWFGVFGEHATVVLPPSEKARVAALWELVDDGAGFDETLDALISGGLRDLPGFVLVSRSEDETRIVLRGQAEAYFATPDDVVHLEGERATTWVERTLTGVTRIRIEVAEETAPDELSVAGGLVRLATAEWPTAVPVPQPETQPETQPEASQPVESAQLQQPGAGLEPPTEAMPTVPPAPAAAAPTGPPPAGPPPPVPDHDGLTRGGADHSAFARPQPGIPGQPPAPDVTARPVARLVFSGGETVEVDRPVLVGRAPEPQRFAETGEPRLVAVPSPHQEISSTHLEVRPGSGADHGSAVVTDLGSTNGTLLLQPGLPPEDLKAGIAVQLVPGAVIDLGDGVTIQVVNP